MAKYNHTPASAIASAIPATAAGVVTVTAAMSNTDRVWVGTDSRIAVWPWYGVAVSPGGTVTFAAAPGVAVYTNSPSEPASVTVTIT